VSRILTGMMIAGVLMILILAGCTRQQPEYFPEYTATPPSNKPVYLFGVHPLHNPQRLHEVYGPVIDYLNRRIPEVSFELEASRSYEEYDRKLYARRFHVALANPYETFNALQHGYRVFARMGDGEEFYGIILVRRDSGIRSVADLKGKAVSFPAPSAIVATMMPLLHLATLGLDVNRDITRLFTGSQESSIMSVYEGTSAAGATWPVPWKAMQKRNPKVAEALEVKWRTPGMVTPSLMARDDLPPDLVARVSKLLVTLHAGAEGRVILAGIPLSRFEAADDAAYRPVGDFLRKYRAVVRDPGGGAP
jgi:phosphonate transport system substrate-binding protein